jgi:hypothetical protein
MMHKIEKYIKIRVRKPKKEIKKNYEVIHL